MIVVSPRRRAAGPAGIAAARALGRGVGRGELDREGVRSGMVDLQRARIVSAMIEVVAERGVARATIAHVVARSGVSRRTFYELFDDREDCFIAAFELAIEHAAARVAPAHAAAEGWIERMRAGLRALLEFLDDEPGLGRLAVVDALGAGPAALDRRTQVVEKLIDAVDEARRDPRRASGLTRLTAEGVVGAVLSVLHARLAGRGARPMVEMLGPLMAMIVLPYQGRAAAERESTRRAPRRRPSPARPAPADPLRGLGMRVTYRTVRVLATIAESPGASNREVAQAAGVSDQGQISKLLVRLEQHGLVANAVDRHGRGEPNAWRLTPRGREVVRAIERQAEQLTR